MRVIGYDSGKHAGWAGIEIVRPGARAKAFACGVLDWHDGNVDRRVAEALHLMVRWNVDLVGVEIVEEVYDRERFGPNMAGHLLRAARLGGKIYQAAVDHGFAAEEITAETWRRWLVGVPQADNPAIAATIKTRVEGWPTRSNNHERDGAGVALFVGERALRRAAGLPV